MCYTGGPYCSRIAKARVEAAEKRYHQVMGSYIGPTYSNPKINMRDAKAKEYEVEKTRQVLAVRRFEFSGTPEGQKELKSLIAEAKANNEYRLATTYESLMESSKKMREIQRQRHQEKGSQENPNHEAVPPVTSKSNVEELGSFLGIVEPVMKTDRYDVADSENGETSFRVVNPSMKGGKTAIYKTTFNQEQTGFHFTAVPEGTKLSDGHKAVTTISFHQLSHSSLSDLYDSLKTRYEKWEKIEEAKRIQATVPDGHAMRAQADEFVAKREKVFEQADRANDEVIDRLNQEHTDFKTMRDIATPLYDTVQEEVTWKRLERQA